MMASIIRFLAVSWAFLVVFGLRQTEENQPSQALELGLLELLEEDRFAMPLTPRRDDDEHPESSPGALMEEEEAKCPDGYKKTGKVLGKGAYGTVYEVKDSSNRKLALKEPQAAGREENLHEINVMKASEDCPNVLPLVKAKPCVNNKAMPYSFVTELMPTDLQKWVNSATKAKLKYCYPKVAKGIKDGLECLHAAGYVHNDLKPDNVLIKGTDIDGCPESLTLADFGLTAKIGEVMGKYSKMYYPGSFHIPASLFAGLKDSLGISKRVGTRDVVMVDEKIDWCSWANLAWTFFEKVDEDLRQSMGQGRCGPMGPGRRYLMP